MTQYRVAALEKATIPCGLRLVLAHPGDSEAVNITLTEYWQAVEKPGFSAAC